jgi:formyltetrahydrofolate synthetase
MTTTYAAPADPVSCSCAAPLRPGLLPVPSDLAIAESVTPLPVAEVAARAGILAEELEMHGPLMAKVSLAVRERLTGVRPGRLVIVAGINPTSLGEGKSTTTVGLSQGLARVGRRVVTCVRQPSLGPTFGIKGGAAGGGWSQVIPMQEFNLHCTNDIHAVSITNNLLAAAIETRMLHEATQTDEALFRRMCPPKGKAGTQSFSPIMLRRLRKLGIDKLNPASLTNEEVSRFVRLDIDPATVTWNRVVDVNDRALRAIEVGHGAAEAERIAPRATKFDIAVASEVMAVLALATDLADLRERLGRIVVGESRNGELITADDLGVGGALTVLMKDALMPTLFQTLEHTPTLVHAGPFANLASGNSSVVADQIALQLVGEDGFVVTEAGFGSEIGLEKFVSLKCRSSGLKPAVAVIVATVRALKMHGGGPPVVAGTPLSDVYRQEDVNLVKKGCGNLERHVAHAAMYGVPVVVCCNRFSTDTQEELDVVLSTARKAGAYDAVVANHWEEGGAGAEALAHAVVKASDAGREADTFQQLYESDATLKKKIEVVATKVYGASGVDFSDEASAALDKYQKLGFGQLPVCIAKTQYSLSADAGLKGAPTGFTVPVREVRLSAGAGFVLVLCGTIQTMPGLSTRPAYYDIDIDTKTGKVIGLM